MYAEILQGPYAGDFIILDSSTGAAAIADGWGRDLNALPYPFVEPATLKMSPYVEWPQSMRTWLLGVGYVDTTGKVPIVLLTKANPTVVTVGAGDIAKFVTGQPVTISGTGTAADGVRTIGTKTGNTFPLVGVDLSGIAANVANKGYAKP